MYLHRPRIGLKNKPQRDVFFFINPEVILTPKKKNIYIYIYPEVMMLSIRLKGNKKNIFPVNSNQTTGCLITITKALALIIQQEIL